MDLTDFFGSALSADELPFFDDDDIHASLCGTYKIYCDGGHLIGSKIKRTGGATSGKAKKGDVKDGDFDRLYWEGFVNMGLRDKGENKALSAYLFDGLTDLYPDCHDLDVYVAERVQSKLNNLYHRKKRFRRKAYLNDWNYFVTLTYDDNKHDADSFRKKLRRALSNFHTRRGWRYMGVFETAPETGRLHFHGLMYIPDGEMVGRLDEIEDYSTAKHCMQTHVENSFFAKKFGRSDFVELNAVAMRYGQTVDYILKYIAKTGERIVYSRGIPTEVCKALTRDDIITEMCDFAGKFLLFDDVLDSERWTCRPLMSLALPNKGYSPPIVA